MLNEGEVEQRVCFVAGSMLCAYVETAMEHADTQQPGGGSGTGADLLLKRAFTMYRHPLLLRMAEIEASTPPRQQQLGAVQQGKGDLRLVGVKMVLSRLVPAGLVMDAIRMVDGVRKRTAAGAAGAAGAVGNGAAGGNGAGARNMHHISSGSRQMGMYSSIV